MTPTRPNATTKRRLFRCPFYRAGSVFFAGRLDFSGLSKYDRAKKTKNNPRRSMFLVFPHLVILSVRPVVKTSSGAIHTVPLPAHPLPIRADCERFLNDSADYRQGREMVVSAIEGILAKPFPPFIILMGGNSFNSYGTPPPFGLTQNPKLGGLVAID